MVRFPADLLFDESDWLYIGQHSWSVYRDGFVFTNINGRHVELHRWLMKSGKKKVEHINGNRLDNRRANLRVVAPEQPIEVPKYTNKSGYRDVSWNKQSGKWVVRIPVYGGHVMLGMFDDLEEAGRVAYEYRRDHLDGPGFLSFRAADLIDD